MDNTIAAFGITWPFTKEGKDAPAPNPLEVAIARTFIERFARRTKTIRPTHSSYGLKHACERWAKAEGKAGYVSNGAFIQAARDLGIEMKPVSHGNPNVEFALSWEKSAFSYR